MFDPNDLDTVTGAYHEAGHVLMAHLLGGEVVHVTLESEDEEVMGHTTVRWHTTSEAQRRRCSALTALAGPVAETRWRGQPDLLDGLTAWRADWREVEVALAAEALHKDPRQQLDQWLREVVSQLQDPVAWEHLCRIADALEAHGTLDDVLLDDVLGR
jgi:hypothetical protein